MQKRYGVDGVMIGRAAIGYPWIFNEIKHYRKTGSHIDPPTISERVNACKQHLEHSNTPYLFCISNAFSGLFTSPLPKIGIRILGLFLTSPIRVQSASPLYICFLVLP
jgi:tRNA-dihydrouridine synthase